MIRLGNRRGQSCLVAESSLYGTAVMAGSSKSDPDLAHTYSTCRREAKPLLGESAKRFEVARLNDGLTLR